MRALSAEGVLSLKPTLIMATTAAGPASTLEQLKATGIEIAILPDHYDYDSVIKKIEAVGKATGKVGGSQRPDRAGPRRHEGAGRPPFGRPQEAARALPDVDERRRAAGRRPRHRRRRHHPPGRRHQRRRRLCRLPAADTRSGDRLARRLHPGAAPVGRARWAASTRCSTSRRSARHPPAAPASSCSSTSCCCWASARARRRPRPSSPPRCIRNWRRRRDRRTRSLSSPLALSPLGGEARRGGIDERRPPLPTSPPSGGEELTWHMSASPPLQ